MGMKYTFAGMVGKENLSTNLKTGEWRSRFPFHMMDKCKHCMLCVAYCPEGTIKHTTDAKLTHIDYDFCKGCGVCAKVCPFGAIEMKPEEEREV